jgi:hypothetical protein
MGTYNYFDSTSSISNHYLYDVYPYLVWGNTALDPTTIYERFAHDYLSQKITYYSANNSPAVYRGDELMELFASVYTDDITDGYTILNYLNEFSEKVD